MSYRPEIGGTEQQMYDLIQEQRKTNALLEEMLRMLKGGRAGNAKDANEELEGLLKKLNEG